MSGDTAFPSRSQRHREHGGVVCLVVLLVLAATAPPAHAHRHDQGAGRLYLSGEGGLFYGKAGTALAGAGIALLRTLYIAELFDDDGDCGWDSHSRDGCCRDRRDCRSRCDDCDGPWSDDLDMPVEGYQLGGSVGYFVAPGLAVGWRLLTHSNDAADRVRSFWGGGPEVSVYGPEAAVVRPFASVGALYTWERSADRLYREHRPARTSVLLRTGFSLAGPRSALYLAASYQAPAGFDGRRAARVSRPWGIGLGLSVFVR